jgi:putative redox protein
MGISEDKAKNVAEPQIVIVSSESGLTQEIAAGAHHWRSDEPLPLGTGSGPTPYDLLLSALGACTSMTLRLYAQRKGWDLQRITVRLRHDRIHAKDCTECETKEGFLDRIDRQIELAGTLDDEQKKRLLEIAEKCPVHRTLKSEIQIVTTVALASLLPDAAGDVR